MKSRRATFASFIHQIDATIACHVIGQCNASGVPIYTVHYNFFTNALHASTMPKYYINAFFSLRDPLYLINRLIYDNVIRYSKKYCNLMNRKEMLLDT